MAAACKGSHVDAESPKAMAGIEAPRMTRAGGSCLRTVTQ